jgi:predicted aspartyl protease
VAVSDLRTALDVVFLVDTGADASVLGPADAAALGIDATPTGNLVAVSSVTGSSQYARRLVTLASRAGHELYLYRLSVLVAAHSPEAAELPSILGRDVLNRWHMSYRPTKDKLTFDIVRYDGRIEVR